MSITFNDRDEFQRKQIAEKAIQLLRADIDISPMVIDGSWGTGKTEFCHKLINLMTEEDTHHLIYVDAFQADHADEPLLTVLAEVVNILPSEEDKESFIKKAIPAARYGLKTLAKAGVAHLLRQDAADVVNDFDKEIQQAANKAIDASVESVLKDHVKASESLKTLQETLQGIAQEKPIVLFVDELDRCRPDFAVNMLEIIKHTFNVEGVQFVLVTNSQQLRSSINHCYGETVDAQRYLDKFLKYSFSLPQVQGLNTYQETSVSLSHYKNLVRTSNVLEPLKLQECGSIRVIEQIVKINKLSLREVETLVRHLEVYVALSQQGHLSNITIFGYKTLTVLAIAIYSIRPKLGNAILSQSFDAKDVGSILGKTGLTILTGQSRPDEMELLCYLICSSNCKNSETFIPEGNENKEKWDSFADGYFRGSFFRPDEGYASICKDALTVLSLH
ncbi:P-loop NTPase fold protein [Vibrio sp. Isolate30]|uniref:KAP family P-loop NTPase fold protein n=1 Tax=Vibrio sp. Isolate30 TaxID=2908536 RepID=UPI001EFE33AF|nr:P-loop NTPase fold protein [Vibrio sp. Isolate30]MCG9632761.1 KAP family NTPase [Vibrio sp. Isolate30]